MAYFLSAARQRVELEPLKAQLGADISGRNVTVRAAEAVSPLATRASRAFFEFGASPASALRLGHAPEGPPPAVYREKDTQLIRVAYREIMVRFKRAVPARIRTRILEKHHLCIRRKTRFVPDQAVVLDPSGKRLGALLLDTANALAECDEIVFAAPNFVSQYRRQAAAFPAAQWHLKIVSAAAAWKLAKGKGCVVAVLDDGVDVDHPNLKAAIRKNPDPGEPLDKVGRDFFVSDDDPQEYFNPRPKRYRYPYNQMAGNDIHGTPCAGVVAARGKNAVGVAPLAKILAVKIFHADDLASDARVADAIRYAALHADVLSCSWSGSRSPDVELAMQDARELGRSGKGAIVCCAAGNDYGDPVGFPASLPTTIGVGASTDEELLANYSNVGPEVDLVAPSSGGKRGIYTTDVSLPNRGFNTGSATAGGADGLHTNDFGGTSSATPLVAGVAALVLSANKPLTADEVKEVLTTTAVKIGNDPYTRGRNKRYGYGRVDARAAVDEALRRGV